MSLSSQENRIQYAGNGAATVFAFPYRFLSNTDLVVERTIVGVDYPLVLGTDYTVAGAGVVGGGTVTLLAALGGTETLTIYRDTERTQQVDYVPQDNFPAETHETALDRAVMHVQDLFTKIKRTLRIPVTGGEIAEMTKSARAGKMVGFDLDSNLALDVNRADLTRLIAANPVAALTSVTDYGSVGDPTTAVVDYGSIA